MAIRDGEKGPSSLLPETNYAKPARNAKDDVRTAVLIGASLFAVGLLARWAVRKATGATERDRRHLRQNC